MDMDLDGDLEPFVEDDPERIPLELEGIEFSALASGLHDHEGPDFIYFVKSSKNEKRLMYGMACYRRHILPGLSIRDAVMRSVGIFCTHYAFLAQHQQFLDKFVEKVRTPNLSNKNKKTLQKYFKKHNATTSEPVPSPALSSYLPSGAFNYLLTTFGPKIFLLWKYMLMQKRILICADPPVKVMSLITYASTFLCRHTIKSSTWSHLNEANPLFYVNISSQIQLLQEQECYIACTTERIFERKPQSYDIFVRITQDDLGKSLGVAKGPKREVIFTVHNGPETKLTEGDHSRFKILMHKFQAADEGRVIGFMQELNNKLLYGIGQIKRANATVKPSDMPKFGLHPSDFKFFISFVGHYDIELNFSRPLCSCCC